MRIVALIASASEMLHSLDLTSFQVGRSHECDYPEQIRNLPICTSPTFPVDGSSAEIDNQVRQKLTNALSIYEVFGDVLARIQPTHIVTQTQCKVCAVSLDDVEHALTFQCGSRPTLISLEPNCLNDIWEDLRRIANGCGVRAKGEEVIRELQARINAIQERAASAAASTRRPRVACIEWHQPLMAAGNWVPELVALANAENLFGTAGRHSPWMTWEDLAAADPDVIITMPCGFDLDRTSQEMYWLTDRSEWAHLRAVRESQVYLTDGNRYMNRPGPTVVESLQILAEILHPSAFKPELEGVGWRHWPA